LENTGGDAKLVTDEAVMFEPKTPNAETRVTMEN
jgi:hypothetical protein